MYHTDLNERRPLESSGEHRADQINGKPLDYINDIHTGATIYILNSDIQWCELQQYFSIPWSILLMYARSLLY